MQPIRLIAMDMDGTLLTQSATGVFSIPPENIAALRLAHECGVELALASGRLPDDAGFYALDAGLPMHLIGLNGAVMLHGLGQAPVMERCLPEAVARRVMALMLEAGLDVTVFTAWEAVSLGNKSLAEARMQLSTWFGRSGGRMTFRNRGQGVDSALARTGKVVAISHTDPEGMAAVRARIRAEFPDVEISSSWWSNFEVNAAGVNKGTALAELARQLGIPMSQVMTIGDNDNDVPMLRAAGIGVAMGNATPAARSAADHLTLPFDQFGVAAAIRSLVLGEEVGGVIPL